MKPTAGIILSTAFVMPAAQAFSDYIGYMDRPEAQRNEHFDEYNAFSNQNAGSSFNTIEGAGESQFETYNDYMGNPEKTSSLFTRTYDTAPPEVVKYMKEYFHEAQMNRSPLWQHVFSFKNEWLIDHGIMSAETGEVNQLRLQEAARLAVNQLEKKEQLHGEWTGAIHYNTDNIHVHIGYTERNSSRPLIEVPNGVNPNFYNLERKGKFLKKNIRATRAKFINELLTMDDMLMQTSEQFNKMIDNAKGYSENFVTDQYATLFQNLYEAMPANRRFWKYGYAKGQKFQYQVDAITNLYLNTEQSAEVEKLRQYLAPISKEYEAAYGNPKNQPTYEDNKLYGKDGLYHKIGNVVLSKLSEYDKNIRSQNRTKGARLSDIDLESLAIEESIVPSDLPPLDEIYLPGDEPIAKQDIDEYENLYFDSLSQSLPVEEYPDEPFVFSFEQTLTMPTKTLPETQSPEMKKAVSRLKDYFAEHETSLEDRTQLLIEEMNQKPKNIEKRGVRITMGDTPGQYKSNPVSLMHSETLKKDIVLSEKVEDSGHIPKELLQLQAKDIAMELKKLENAPKHNLDSFSEKNKKAILEQMPDAIFVYGSGQWRLKGRKIMESEKENPIIVIRPVIDKETNIVKRYVGYDAYDVSQTEPLSKTEWAQVRREMNTQGEYRSKKGFREKYTPSLESEVKKDIYHLKKMLRDDTQSYLNQRLYRQLQFEIENGM